VVARPGTAEPAERTRILEQLAAFAEDRYLHQTMVSDDGSKQFFEDLPLALHQLGSSAKGEWRVHFHLPLFIDSFGKLHTSQAEIDACLDALRELGHEPPLEVETYAWDVLPPALQHSSLAEGIAMEINWLRQRIMTHH